MRVVILARVSTDKQEYQRQVVELTDYWKYGMVTAVSAKISLFTPVVAPPQQ